MGKTVSYIFLAILAIVGLGSAYGIHGAAEIMRTANEAIRQNADETAERSQDLQDDSYASQIEQGEPQSDPEIDASDAAAE